MEPVWLQHYPPGVPAGIELGDDDTLVTMMDRSFREYADRPSFACMGRTLSYRRATAPAVSST